MRRIFTVIQRPISLELNGVLLLPACLHDAYGLYLFYTEYLHFFKTLLHSLPPSLHTPGAGFLFGQ
jgi:hypothetical protein